MKITNRLNLPQPLVDAVANDPYHRGSADISVTSLLAPPRKIALDTAHEAELEEDASDRIWSLLGQSIHTILERADKTGATERRLSIQVEGWKVSGAMDRYVDGLIQDYKCVTVWKFKDQTIPEEYEEQLNVYAEILRQNDYPVTKLEIVGILRDWSKLEAWRNPEYPQTQVVVRDVPLWSREMAQEFIRVRVVLHQQSRIRLPFCDQEERWQKPTQWAVQKPDAKRATKLYESEAEAKAHIMSDSKLVMVKRPGESTRCKAYCSALKFCSQGQATLKQE